ncbi:hypothetical protein CC78DRAFT_469416 [Lojkania enalia]|uniref:Transcription initiation factor TFIID subunit 4 n=1 Tax=Lojkania enalia TaxID=147567 RepID=A0A9P4K5S4_9PLEO|nr:hypothetical protein CC78DRAFT_469416 [Didymosphaeria enalia]
MHVPPLQTQSYNQGQRAFSPPSYQQSPGAMSPTGVGIPPMKRQRLSPNPPSPYQSPFPPATSPYASSPTGAQHLNLPMSPASPYTAPTSSFNTPQPYQPQTDANARAPANSMPPPKLPYSKTQDNAELEKANARDLDVNNISDVLTGSGIDLRAEEDNLLHSYGNRNYGSSFNSQTSSTISPHGSFSQWPGTAGHGAFQGTGPLSEPVTQEQQEVELARKHSQAARALAEASQAPLSDPFLFANKLRQKVASRAYEHGISVNLDGLFDRIPEHPQNVTRTSMNAGDKESISALQADSLLNKNAPFVEVLSLISIAAEDRIRTILEDAFALSQGRQNTSHGVIPPNLTDLAEASGEAKQTTATPTNLSKSAWEAPDSAVSNHIANDLKRKVAEDIKFEEARIAKRQKRLNKASATPAETTPAPLPPLPEKMTKKERDRLNKIGQTDEVLHRKANETASMALGGIGGKKKYSWMIGGGGGGLGSGASTPRINTAVGGGSGTSTPTQPQLDRGLMGRKRNFGAMLENGEAGGGIQVRDLLHVLENDGREKKTLVFLLAKLKNTERDEQGDKKTGSAPVR